ncbi:hypothetical protein Tco_0201866 [Tanacetum coccineum]
MDFPLLTQLESHKDARMADIMGLLRLESPAAEIPEASQLQPLPELRGNVAARQLSISNALVPLVEPLSAKTLVGDASTSGVPATATTLSTTFFQASTALLIPATNHEVSDVGPSTKVSSPLMIVFEKETLETTPEHGASD